MHLFANATDGLRALLEPPWLGPIGAGAVVEIAALALIPFVLVRRKEPSSTVAWILALVFLPGLGALLFVMFGRERLRLPVQWKREADEALVRARPRGVHALSLTARERTLAKLDEPEGRALFRVGAALGGVAPSHGNEVELLVDGEATYEALGRAIDEARDHVYAEYYLIRNDATAAWFQERLVAAAQRGVKVRLLVDGYGSFWLRRRFFRELRAGGVDVRVFLPARLLFFQPMNLRNHRKIVVVDGAIGFTGGINVGDEYKGLLGPWRDMHLRLRGPSVQELSRVFELDWHFVTRHELPHDTSKRDEPGKATVSIVRSGPDLEGPQREAIQRTFFAAITTAKARVWITTAYFIPDRSIVVALQTAALRGVDVRLLFPSKSNHPFVFQAGRSFYEDLLGAGVAIYEYGPGMIHAKTMVVDGKVALVGSANMDVRSFRLNFEVHAVVSDDTTAEQMEAIFERDLAVSKRIDLDEFRARGALARVVEGAARLASPLM